MATRRLGCLLVWAVLAASCAASAPLEPARVRTAATASAPQVVVLQSTNSQLFRAPVESFIGQVDATVTLFDDASVDRSRLVAAMRARKPDLIVTLGTRATRLAIDEFEDVPVLFTMVVNYRRLPLEGRSNVMGIALESSTASEFSQFKMILPKLAKSLAFYVPNQSGKLVEEARVELAKLGVELEAVPVESAEDVKVEYARHAGSVDGVWLLNDPVLMNKATFEYLRAQCEKDKLPLLASFSDEFARLGALMSVSTDLSSLGSQAAAMATRKLQQGVSPAEIGVQPPISTKLVVNVSVARALGIELSDDSLPFIDELIAEQHLAKP